MTATARSLYPNAPGFYPSAPETSRQSAKAAAPRDKPLRQLCEEILSIKPMTADECAEKLGVDRLSIRPRISQLFKLGKIEDSGLRRQTISGSDAVVWQLAKPKKLTQQEFL